MDGEIYLLNANAIKSAAAPYGIRGILVMDRAKSLMGDAAELVKRGSRRFEVLVAEEQTAGRGRHGRTWESPKSLGLYFAVILYEDEIGDVGPNLSVVTALAALKTVRGSGCIAALIKWPNDIVIGKKKIAGVLIEKPAASGAYIAGIGINVHQREMDFPPEIREIATSLYNETRFDVSRNEVAGRLYRNIHDEIGNARHNYENITLPKYKEMCITLGKNVEVVTDHGIVAGRAEDIAIDGALIINASGSKKAIYAGDVLIKE